MGLAQNPPLRTAPVMGAPTRDAALKHQDRIIAVDEVDLAAVVVSRTHEGLRPLSFPNTKAIALLITYKPSTDLGIETGKHSIEIVDGRCPSIDCEDPC